MARVPANITPWALQGNSYEPHLTLNPGLTLAKLSPILPCFWHTCHAYCQLREEQPCSSRMWRHSKPGARKLGQVGTQFVDTEPGKLCTPRNLWGHGAAKILLMDEILHRLGALNYCNSTDFRDFRWCKISSINNMYFQKMSPNH